LTELEDKFSESREHEVVEGTSKLGAPPKTVAEMLSLQKDGHRITLPVNAISSSSKQYEFACNIAIKTSKRQSMEVIDGLVGPIPCFNLANVQQVSSKCQLFCRTLSQGATSSLGALVTSKHRSSWETLK